MIRPEEIIPAGVFNKTHGIKGELSATFGHDVEPDTLRCLFVDMDGIPVPFFIESSRPRTADTWLVTLDGIDSEEKARPFVGKQFGIHADDLPEPEELDPDADGFYASDLIGFSISDSTLGELGEITDVNDQTENERPSVVKQWGLPPNITVFCAVMAPPSAVGSLRTFFSSQLRVSGTVLCTLTLT